MEYLDNHAVLRWEMIKKVQYPHCGEHLGEKKKEERKKQEKEKKRKREKEKERGND